VASIYKNLTVLAHTSDEEKAVGVRALITKESTRRDELVAQLRTLQSADGSGLRGGESEFGAALERILTTVPPGECTEQATHVEWNDHTKRLSQNVFREQTRLLEVMKAEKKKKNAAAAGAP
jgi:hypothetical protein